MYKLRDYQQRAVDSTVKYFRTKSDPAVIVLPTGAGKSLVIAEMAKIAKGRVLVLTHVKELVEQNHAKYSSYDLEAGIYSAGLNKKQTSQKAEKIKTNNLSILKCDFSNIDNLNGFEQNIQEFLLQITKFQARGLRDQI